MTPNDDKRIYEAVKKLRLIDDVFFSIFFENNPDGLQYILRIIIEKPDLQVLEVQTQKSIENIYGRSVRFDVFATDSEGKLYDLEIQRADSGATPRRARYNSALLDFHELKAGAKFEDLPETYVIFITENDVLGGGELIYRIERVIMEKNKKFDDGAHIVYINSRYDGDNFSALKDLMHDFWCTDPDEMRHTLLAERMRFLKNPLEGAGNMGIHEIIREVYKDDFDNLEKRVTKEVAENVTKKTLIENIRNMMKNFNVTAEQAMNGLEVSPELRKEIAPLI